MARYTHTLRDQNLAPIAGAYVAVLAPDGSAATLTDDNDQSLANPFLTDVNGVYTYNVENSGLYKNSFTFGGRKVFEEVVPVGLEMLNDQIIAVAAHVDELDLIYADLNGANTIGTVAAVAAQVEAVGDNIAAVLAVNANEANINIVAANLSGGNTIGAVATNIANVNIVSGAIANVNTVAGISAAVTTVAAANAAVGTVSANIASVNAVSSSITNVNLVGLNITSVNTAASNIAAIIAAPGYAATAAAAAAQTALDAAAIGNAQAEIESTALEVAEDALAATNAVAALVASSGYVTYQTKALAIAASLAGSIATGTNVLVVRDETCGNLSTVHVQNNPISVSTTGHLTFVRIVTGTPGVPDGMPDGAVGYWNPADVVTSPVHVIPNRATTVPYVAQLNRMTRNAFKYASMSELTWFGSPNDATNVFTDRAGVGPDGKVSASHLVMTSGAERYFQSNADWTPAVAQCFTIWARSKTGVNQVMRLSCDNGTTKTAKTVTPLWDMYYVTGTPTAGLSRLRIYNDASSNALDIEVTRAIVYAGATPGTYYPPAGHLYLGRGEGDTLMPTVSNGVLDATAGAPSTIELAETISSREMTYIAIVNRHTNSLTYSNNYIFRNRAGNPEAGLMDLAANGGPGRPVFKWNSSDNSIVMPGTLDLYGKGWHVLTTVVRQNRRLIYIDDTLLYAGDLAPIAKTYDQFQIGSQSTGHLFGYMVGPTALYQRALTGEEVARAARIMAQDAGTGISVTFAQNVVQFEGDSIVASSSPASFAMDYVASAPVGTFVGRNAVGGSVINTTLTMTSLNARAPDMDAGTPAAQTGRKRVLFILIGANDLPIYGNAATFTTALAAYIDARRAVGWQIALATILPRTLAGFNALRNTANATMATWVGGRVDTLIDFAAEATMGPDAAASNAALYPDGLHPSALGYTYLTPLVIAGINALLAA